jgi:2,4'-dihydroxyacetophenone dioxygenase
MPIDLFHPFDDGLNPANRRRDQFTTDTNLDDDKLWVPYVDGVWFQLCHFNVTSGGFSNVLKILPGMRLPVHYHISTVHGYTLRGSWRYLEHDWVATPGTYIFEPAGEAHTLVVDADAPEPMVTFFVLSGGLIYLDNLENGKVIGYDDGFTLLELARKHYSNVGLDVALVDRTIR